MADYDVVALGELLIDFTQNGMSAQGNPLFEANPGGAPCNVLAMLTKLGRNTAFIGKVGDDSFGHMLETALKEQGISTKGLYFDKEVHTTLALVHTAADGDRDFSFYRNPGADMMLTADEVSEELISSARIFHFGTLSMTHEGVRAATEQALNYAKNSGILISFDPNLREPLWSSLDEAAEMTRRGLSCCDILKISDNEIQWITGIDDYDDAIAALRKEYDIPLILLSLGKEGSRAYLRDLRVEVPAFVRNDTIETTGAGDTFGACCINYVLEHGNFSVSKESGSTSGCSTSPSGSILIPSGNNGSSNGASDKSSVFADFTEEMLTEMLTFANAAASIVTTKKGALRVMPEREEVLAYLKS